VRSGDRVATAEEDLYRQHRHDVKMKVEMFYVKI
jgi:hypothetical protein